MDPAHRLKRLRFRAWHRGTREADLLIGGFFDAYHGGWDEEAIGWVERFLEEQDVDIMAWAIGTQPVPERWNGAIMRDLQTLSYIEHAK
jgi:antitoxin CptB